MPRPPKCRRVAAEPGVTYFKPRGVPLRELGEVYLPVDGFEAVRLADHLGLNMEEAATRMGVSRHTFGRILAEARAVMARAVVEGLALRIEGGHYVLDNENRRGPRRRRQIEPPVRAAASRDKEQQMTVVAVSSQGPTLDDMVDPRFGRAAGFVIVDTETGETRYVENGASQAMAHGAGVNAARRVAEAGAQMVLTGYVGPKAFTALDAAGVAVGQDLAEMTVGQAIERFKAGDVAAAAEPNK